VRPAALLRDRRGMTLTELLVALLLAGFILGPVFTFLRQQSDAYAMGASRMMLTQNHRFAINTLERDLRTAGSGIPVPGVQPTVVYAGSDVFAFNADYATRDTADLAAVYVDTAAAPEDVDALIPSRHVTIPGSSFVYPDSAYHSASGNSQAETIIFYFTPDAGTPRTDDFVLMRQVNDRQPAVVARNILRTSNGPFFQYQELVVPDSGSSYINTVANGDLPMAHTAALHGIPERGDSMPAARIDRIRTVRVSFTVTNGPTNARQQTRAVSRMVRLPNAGLAVSQMCGDAPQAPTAVAAAVSPGAAPHQVTLTWNASVDESSGEHDVLRYIVYRKPFSAASFTDPIGSVSAGSTTYSFSETPGAGLYTYGVAAQDCTPAASDMATTAAVNVPAT
jgi:prepilin-type N-terminal cleavage/methylation domain-containing protein